MIKKYINVLSVLSVLISFVVPSEILAQSRVFTLPSLNVTNKVGIGTYTPVQPLSLGNGVYQNFLFSGTDTDGSTLRIGLSDKSRGIIICDSSSIGSIGPQTILNNPYVKLFNGTGTSYIYLTSNAISSSAGGQFYYSHGIGAQWSVAYDRTVGNMWTFMSGTGVELVDTDADQSWLYLEPKINQSGTAGYTGLKMDVTETALGSGNNYLMDLQINSTSKFVVDNGGKVGIGTNSPATQLHVESTAPYQTLHNTTNEDISSGRESKLIFKGNQSGGEESTLGTIAMLHRGSSDDERGQLIVSLNDGNDGDSPIYTMTLNTYTLEFNATTTIQTSSYSYAANILLGENLTLQSGSHPSAQRNIYLDILPSAGVDSEIRLGDTGTTGEYTLIDSSGHVGIGARTIMGQLHLDASAGSDSTGTWLDNASVTTTDATITTIYTLSTTTDRNYRIVADIVGGQDDGSNTMSTSWSFVFKNVSGTVTELQDVVIGTPFDDSAGVSISGVVSGTDYLIQVTGITAETWNWELSVKVVAAAH